MSTPPPSWEILWTRFLAGETLSAQEEAALLRALEEDEARFRDLLEDEDLHLALSALGRSGRDAEAFARSLRRRIDTERDGDGFVRKVESRLARQAGRRATRRAEAGASGWGWKAAFAAAVALFVVAVALTTLPRKEPAPLPRGRTLVQEIPAPSAADPEEVRERRERERLTRELVRTERERARLAEEAKRAEGAKRQEELKAKEAELEAAARKYREDLRKARERRAPEPEPPLPSLPATQAVVARLLEASGASAAAGAELHEGQGLIVGPGGRAVVGYPDGTRLAVGAGSEIRDLRAEGGKRLRVEKGIVDAQVARQPAGRAMEFATAHGQARVLGTVLRLIVHPDATSGTRVEVREGKVRLSNLAGESVDIPADRFAVAAEGRDLVLEALPKLLLAEDFEDPKAVAARWIPLPGGFPVTTAGGLEIDVSPRPNDPYPDDWHATGGLLGRTALRVPFRVSVDVEVTHRHSHVVAAMHFLPRLEPGGSPDEPLWICFKRGEYEFISGAGEVVTPQIKAAGPWPRKERWTAEFDKGELRFLVDGREVLRHPQVARQGAYFLRMDANAQLDAPAGAKVRFDNLRVEEIR